MIYHIIYDLYHDPYQLGKVKSESEKWKWKVKVKSEKWKSEKWSVFGPLFSSNFIYIIDHV